MPPHTHTKCRKLSSSVCDKDPNDYVKNELIPEDIFLGVRTKMVKGTSLMKILHTACVILNERRNDLDQVLIHIRKHSKLMKAKNFLFSLGQRDFIFARQKL